MKTYTTVSTSVDVDVEIDLDEVIEDMTAGEKEQLIKKLRAKSQSIYRVTEEDKIWQEVRLAAATGDTGRFLHLIETIAWKHHEVFVETSRIARARA